MSTVVDRIVIAVPQLPSAQEQYQQLLGLPPAQSASSDNRPAVRWVLPNTSIELVQREVSCPEIQELVFCPMDAHAQLAGQDIENDFGLNLRFGESQATAEFGRKTAVPGVMSGILPGAVPWKVDHLVLRTQDADACIALFAGKLGLRLALDKTVPEWGGRMVFFRAGKLTLEVIQSESDAAKGHFFWGIAYQCEDLQQAYAELTARGVELSTPREGRKRGTKVATVKSHCLDIPTLLLQPAI